MAVEDAWVLAHQLASAKNLTAALRNYQTLRFARASAVQAQSRANAKPFTSARALVK